jgi:hypothetical protein
VEVVLEPPPPVAPSVTFVKCLGVTAVENCKTACRVE